MSPTKSTIEGRGIAIGIDAGASHTEGILVDANGREIARSHGAGANLRVDTPEAVGLSLASVLAPLLERGEVRAICIGAAGAGGETQVDTLRGIVAPLIPPNVALTIVHDGRIALEASTPYRPAMVVIAGTGSLVYGERRDGTPSRAGGKGARVGDPASGYAIARSALEHTSAALDGLERKQDLATFIAGAIDARSAVDIDERLRDAHLRVAEISALAIHVGAAYESGDQAARSIVEQHGSVLGELANRVAAEVREGDRPLPVALTGGVFEVVPALADVIRSTLLSRGPCDISLLSVSPALGAARLALESIRHE
jgi:glucosamine kinase